MELVLSGFMIHDMMFSDGLLFLISTDSAILSSVMSLHLCNTYRNGQSVFVDSAGWVTCLEMLAESGVLFLHLSNVH